jgi:hypothetical protein
MRPRLQARWLAFLPLLLLVACKSEHERPAPASASALAAVDASSAAAGASSSRARPVSSQLLAIQKSLQASKLTPPPLAAHVPRLTFANGVLALLGPDQLRIFDANAPRLVLAEPLEGPRALLTLADGSLFAVGARACLRWEVGWKRARVLPGLVLLPGAELYPDARRPDLVWVFERGSRGSPGRLSAFPLTAGELPLLLPEQTIELAPADAALLGVTREGVWLYLTPDHAERFGPSGTRLAGLTFERSPLPVWALPAQRLDQSLWIDSSGQVERVQLTPRFARLSRLGLGGSPFAAAVGDQGRLLAAIVISGEGPRFELELFDAALRPLARALLPAESPTGSDDWVQVVSRNQELAVSLREPRVAVGGPDRATIFDGRGRVVFSIPSR